MNHSCGNDTVLVTLTKTTRCLKGQRSVQQMFQSYRCTSQGRLRRPRFSGCGPQVAFGLSNTQLTESDRFGSSKDSVCLIQLPRNKRLARHVFSLLCSIFQICAASLIFDGCLGESNSNTITSQGISRKTGASFCVSSHLFMLSADCRQLVAYSFKRRGAVNLSRVRS